MSALGQKQPFSRTVLPPMSASRQKRPFERWIFCSAKAAIFAPPSVYSLGSSWDFFPPYGGLAHKSSHCCQPQPPIPQCRTIAGLWASMAEAWLSRIVSKAEVLLALEPDIPVGITAQRRYFDKSQTKTTTCKIAVSKF